MDPEPIHETAPAGHTATGEIRQAVYFEGQDGQPRIERAERYTDDTDPQQHVWVLIPGPADYVLVTPA